MIKLRGNQPKPKGFNYRPYAYNEREAERKKIYGHLHGEKGGRAEMNFRKKKPETKYRKDYQSIYIIYGIGILLLSYFFYKVWVGDISLNPGNYSNFFE